MHKQVYLGLFLSLLSSAALANNIVRGEFPPYGKSTVEFSPIGYIYPPIGLMPPMGDEFPPID